MDFYKKNEKSEENSKELYKDLVVKSVMNYLLQSNMPVKKKEGEKTTYVPLS